MAGCSLVVRADDVPNEICRGEDEICRSSGRSVAPWLMLAPEFGEKETVFKFYRLAEGDVIEVKPQQDEEEQTPDVDSVCLGSSSKGWLVCIQPKDCVLFLFNPLSRKTIQLPSVETFPCVTGVYDSGFFIQDLVRIQDSFPVSSKKMSERIVKKMILSSPDPMDEDCIALVIYSGNLRLAFCRSPGIPNSSWTPLDSPLKFYTEIVFHPTKKLFFALTQQRELEAWDLHSGDPVRRYLVQIEDVHSASDWPCSFTDDAELERKSHYCWDSAYLLCDHKTKELFVVTRYIAYGIAQDGTMFLSGDNAYSQYPYKTHTFDVFKFEFMDEDHVELQYLDSSLGNRAFFIGSNPGFALSTTQFPELRPNSIYFTDDHTAYHLRGQNPNHGGHDLGIYDYKENCFLSCYYPIGLSEIRRILPSPIWFTPDVDAEFLASTLGPSF